jgi:hypothetical protein
MTGHKEYTIKQKEAPHAESRKKEYLLNLGERYLRLLVHNRVLTGTLLLLIVDALLA